MHKLSGNVGLSNPGQIDGVMTVDRCSELVETVEQGGPSPKLRNLTAKITTHHAPTKLFQIRNFGCNEEALRSPLIAKPRHCVALMISKISSNNGGGHLDWKLRPHRRIAYTIASDFDGPYLSGLMVWASSPRPNLGY
ncbi:hypothetical protein FUT69_04425 [Xylella taiwanensis]|uniref:hypothetical protein n=1 Tax=Xylella taiwanensis TaxID=1444770 RepID=UPI00135F1C05|nr:hypothetical protein [Xylella taiwanensis]MCD8455635.1 hypothetical protein [Xylella taiwanensis]MCD8458042.1 hypothetical protein [Xylella taiwanensis]MCD8460178.1 hypothetical protein [Xylella taiwanensis]MCD8463764.1 hypothetical protein [Xylella taiwanensis]MCD8464680.1 hypothetical protein [Xylella taiwanensis]